MAKVLPKSKNPKARKPWTVRYWNEGSQHERSFATKREADDFAAKVEHDKRANIFIDPKLGDVSFKQYAATWLAQHSGAANSTRIYASTLEHHINPAIGDTPLRRITRDRVKALLLEELPAKPVSRSIVVTAHVVITAVLGEAVRSKRITENVGERIRIPATQEAAEFFVPSRAQLEQMVGAMPSDWRLVVWLIRGCGLRLGEALAVGQDSVRGQYLRITDQVLRYPDRIGPLKHRNPGQFRDVPLPQWVADAVDKHIAEHGTAEDGRLFRRRNMGSFRHSFMTRAAMASIPREFTPHDLRHLWASTALAGGVPVTDVSRYLGHRSVDMTYRVYSHFIPSSLDTARAVLDADWSATA